MSKENQRQRAEKAAAALRERQRRERRRQVLTVVGVLTAIVLIVGGGFLINSLRDTSEDVAASAPDAGSPYGLTIGPASAPHKVVVYEDFLCPYCGEFETQSQAELAALAEEGKVQVEYRPFVLLGDIGPYSSESALVFGVVLDKSGAEVAKTFHDLLFANQPSEAGPFPSLDDLIQLAGQAGADGDDVKAAVESDEATQWVEDATSAAQDLGVNSTPTIILDGAPFIDGRTADELAANLVEAVQ